ncbi:glycosyltransferase family 2 protein [Sebaldella sp. S0638]|uniref:glycosyltransferase family 2 protein n=1 Tax=Sebaldella sp. S0638 TaxID=2957809 RepID=UPI00209CA49E|nr:glycosyltransferase family 2 protein [Sebaldella sp. S0638]MCP1223396.1 glycosyltransferase family 2 protein [Sebaldella sp. S0638]
MKKNRILAIIVTYNPEKDFIKNYNSVKSQVENIIIIDNNSDNKIKLLLENLKNENVKVIFNEENIGIAAAQNIGIQEAVKNDFEWILLLDDDSYLEREMVEYLLKRYEIYTNKSKVAILAPNIQEKNLKHSMKYIVKDKILFKKRGFENQSYLDNVLTVISSGSMINIEKIKKYGMMKEDYFIDFVDTEFCLRIVSNGEKILAVKDAVLMHEIGKKKEYSIAGIKVRTSNHNSQRLYYMYRNRILVWRKYFFKVFSYISYDIIYSNYQFLLILMFEKEKISKIKAVFKGIKDGLFFSKDKL